MKVKEKLLMDLEGLHKNGAVNIVILGDSVSHGCMLRNNDYENVYHNRLRKMLNAYCENIPVNIINSAIGGTTALRSLERIDNQVLCHKPDLVIVCFGLNDVNDDLEVYINSLKEIFLRVKGSGADIIFMTPNMLNTRVCDDTPKEYYEYAKVTAEMQNNGRMDRYMEGAKALAKEMGVTVCDCYSKWKELSKTQDTTSLLINRINHPTPEMHKLFADELYKIIIGEEASDVETDDGMFKQQ